MYYNKFDKILRLILEDSIQKNELRNYLYENITYLGAIVLAKDLKSTSFSYFYKKDYQSCSNTNQKTIK